MVEIGAAGAASGAERLAPGPASGAVREAVRSEYPLLTLQLAKAFEDDPVSQHFFPNARSRPRRLGAFYGFAVDSIARSGVVYSDSALRGAAVWQDPMPRASGRTQMMRDGFRLLASARGAFGRVARLGQRVHRARPLEPHWYLAILGVAPEHQGQGVASSLLHPILARCDAEGLPAYLESSKKANLPFYEGRGFRVVGELEAPGCPTLWPMLRQPNSR